MILVKELYLHIFSFIFLIVISYACSIVKITDNNILIKEVNKNWGISIGVSDVIFKQLYEYHDSDIRSNLAISMDYYYTINIIYKTYNTDISKKIQGSRFPIDGAYHDVLKYQDKIISNTFINNFKGELYKDEFIVKEYKGIEINKKHLIIVLRFEDTDIMIHLTKIYYKDEDQKIIDEIVNSIKIVYDEN